MGWSSSRSRHVSEDVETFEKKGKHTISVTFPNILVNKCNRSDILLFLLQVDVNTEVGVVRDIRLKELRIYTDYGRCSRPLFIVDNQRLLIKKRDIYALQQRVKL